jgi:hypothetical protein
VSRAQETAFARDLIAYEAHGILRSLFKHDEIPAHARALVQDTIARYDAATAMLGARHSEERL